MTKSKRGRSSRRRSRRSSRTKTDLKWKVVSVLATLAIGSMLAYWWFYRGPGAGPAVKSGTVEFAVFFGNSERDPQELDCSRVFPVHRLIPATDAVARAAIEQLLAGPTAQERREGYFTSLNRNVPIRRLEIQNGLAWIDFGRAFDEGVAGSCRVEAIRAQVEQTLLQFDSIREVRITVEGQEATALQP